MLVVDSRPDDYMRLKEELSPTECQLRFATSAGEALRLPTSLPLHSWLINFRLPDMTGLELFALVRSRTPETACILISDSYSPEEELAARQLGVTLYTCKPLLADWLRSVTLLPKPRENARASPQPSRASRPSGQGAARASPT